MFLGIMILIGLRGLIECTVNPNCTVNNGNKVIQTTNIHIEESAGHSHQKIMR